MTKLLEPAMQGFANAVNVDIGTVARAIKFHQVIQQALANGETTNNPLEDYVIFWKGCRDSELLERYKAFEDKLKASAGKFISLSRWMRRGNARIPQAPTELIGYYIAYIAEGNLVPKFMSVGEAHVEIPISCYFDTEKGEIIDGPLIENPVGLFDLRNLAVDGEDVRLDFSAHPQLLQYADGSIDALLEKLRGK